MSRIFSSIIAVFFIAFNVSAANDNLVKDTIIDLEHICELGEQEMVLLTEIIDGTNPALEHHQQEFKTMLSKLDNCKSKLIVSAMTCNPTESEHEQMHIVPQSKTTADKIAFGCDWFVRVINVLWALKYAYGFTL